MCAGFEETLGTDITCTNYTRHTYLNDTKCSTVMLLSRDPQRCPKKAQILSPTGSTCEYIVTDGNVWVCEGTLHVLRAPFSPLCSSFLYNDELGYKPYMWAKSASWVCEWCSRTRPVLKRRLCLWGLMLYCYCVKILNNSSLKLCFISIV